MPVLGFDLVGSMPQYTSLDVPDGVCIPATDEAAWSHFPKYRWLYNKSDLYTIQEVPHGICGVDPQDYPVIIKPCYSLSGGAPHVRIISDEHEYREFMQPGFLWMISLGGEHLSIDLAVLDGVVVDGFCFQGLPIAPGVFDYWKLISHPSEKTERLCQFVKRYLPDYTGMLNVEMIGDAILECHLRWGDIDRLGSADLMQSVLDLYAGLGWQFNHSLLFGRFYIFAMWGSWGRSYSFPEDVEREVRDEAVFLQIDDPDFYYANPPSNIRIAILGTYDFHKGAMLRKKLMSSMTSQPTYDE